MDVCSGLLEAEKCPLQSRALAAGTRSGHIRRGSRNRLLQQACHVDYSYEHS